MPKQPKKPATKKAKPAKKPAKAAKPAKKPAKKPVGKAKSLAGAAPKAAKLSDAEIRTNVRQCVKNSPPQKPFTDDDTLGTLKKNVQSVKSCVNASCHVAINVTKDDNVNKICARVKKAQG